MDKRTTRAFSIGLLVATLCLYTIYQLDGEDRDAAVSEADMIKLEQQIQSLEEKLASAESTQEPTEETNEEAAEETNEAPTEETETTEQEEKNDVKEVTVTIESGVSIGEISSRLESEGFIEDQYDFNNFLKEKGYEQKIQLGEFKITSDMNYDQIAKIITKQN
ncbi:hypothetical protein Q73_09410 [Bacillus coahuilensis m2-6]|uniref:Aminodeoxychorismate lyase n=1 Tax=Bacillus coahuilensis p1.1.43 TaxID=1150625 RepID=A0A147K7E6_9BACI|nr:endolytic transglycosylase MltG [Bacillus coahuilensis]KUP05987.1 hypothetical protein Q75_09995 [Bacillus coahuilensis p1.1.43]KUP07419.1 hypothetical protein Q73_09410 [Bacillus coahuilensis m2-6]